jgi:hypothetical protein
LSLFRSSFLNHPFIHLNHLSGLFLLYFSFFSRVACVFDPLLLFRSLVRIFFPFCLLCHFLLCFSLLLNNYLWAE